MYVDEVWSVDVDRQILNFEECNDIKYETESSVGLLRHRGMATILKLYTTSLFRRGCSDLGEIWELDSE